MKLSWTATLTLAAVALTAAAAAQTSATSTLAQPQTMAPMPAGSTTSQAQPGYAQPQQNAAQPKTGAPQTQPQYGQAQIFSNANEQVRTAQQQLNAAGLYNGPVDGVMDPDTRAAIARFQQQSGLQRTGSLDEQTLARLTSGQPTGSQSSTATAPATPPSGSSGSALPPTGAGGNPPAPATQR